MKIKDADGDVVRSQDGTGHQAGITWDALLGGDPAPDGDYTWHLKANDAWGNPILDEDGGFTIANEAVPGTAVLSLEPEAATTRASSTTFTLTFAGPVTGLTKADFTRTGTARCDLGKPAGGPVVYTITLSDCTTGIGDPHARLGQRRRRGGPARSGRGDRLQGHDRPLRPERRRRRGRRSARGSRSAAGRTRRSR